MNFNEYDIEYIKTIITCDFETGKCFWKAKPENNKYDKGWNSKHANTEITNTTNGYFSLRFKHNGVNVRIKLHRVVYALYHGEWPNCILDHKDNNKQNNSIHNLIASNKSDNAKNSKSKSESGYKNISECKRTGKWYFRFLSNGKTIKGNRFNDINDAIAERDIYRQLHHYPIAIDNPIEPK